MKKAKKNKQKKMDWDTIIKKLHEVFQEINDNAKLIEESLKKKKQNKPNLALPN